MGCTRRVTCDWYNRRGCAYIIAVFEHIGRFEFDLRGRASRVTCDRFGLLVATAAATTGRACRVTCDWYGHCGCAFAAARLRRAAQRVR